MEKLELVTVWRASRRKGTSVHPHAHHYYELVYYPKGRGISRIGETDHSFCANTFALIMPDTPHSEQHQADGEVICLGFTCPDSLPEALFPDSDLTVYPVLKALLNETTTQAFGYQQVIAAKLSELCVYILRLQNAAAPDTKSFQYIINYLAENYHEKIRLSDCARQLSISYDYFQHRFKQLTGVSPQAFLLTHRLSAAKALLENGTLSCTQIAYQCGFSTSAQFSMLFKRTYGVSPSQYKG